VGCFHRKVGMEEWLGSEEKRRREVTYVVEPAFPSKRGVCKRVKKGEDDDNVPRINEALMKSLASA
jgi:hypothetical protein